VQPELYRDIVIATEPVGDAGTVHVRRACPTGAT
jgi:hypothetical protein